MIRSCDCGRTYDDAKCWALCPHPSLDGAPPSREQQAAAQRGPVPIIRTSAEWCERVERIGETLYSIVTRTQYTITDRAFRERALTALAEWEDLRDQARLTTMPEHVSFTTCQAPELDSSVAPPDPHFMEPPPATPSGVFFGTSFETPPPRPRGRDAIVKAPQRSGFTVLQGGKEKEPDAE
jgi:hypothetical protein